MADWGVGSAEIPMLQGGVHCHVGIPLRRVALNSDVEVISMTAFSQAYGIDPKSGNKPLLTVLLEARDAVSRTDIDVFALTATDAIGHMVLRVNTEGVFDDYHLSSTGTYADPLPGGPRFRGIPAVLNASDLDLISVFAIDDTGQARQTWKPRETPCDEWRGRWSPWTALPASVELEDGLAAVESPDGKSVGVLGLGVDGRIHHIVYRRGTSVGWQQWTKLPGSVKLASAPAVLNSPDGNLLSVFALGVDGRIHQIVSAWGAGGGWQQWTTLPGTVKLVSAPAAINSPDGNMASVFALGVDGRIRQIVFHRGTSVGWQKWTTLPDTAKLASAPAAFNSPDGDRAVVMALGDDGRLLASSYVRSQPRAQWSDWSPAPGGEIFHAAPAIVPRLLYRRSQERVQDLLYGSGRSLQQYFSEVSHGHFTFTEAATTQWLASKDDPSTSRDESLYEFVHAGGDKIEQEKGLWVLKQAERAIETGFSSFSGSDGWVTKDELSTLWLYTGGSGSGVVRKVPSFEVPSLTGGVVFKDEEGLARCGANSGVGLIAHELAHEALDLPDLYPGMQIRRMAINPANDHVFTWLDDGTVCEGSCRHLDRYAPRQKCEYPEGKSATDLVGIGIASDGHAYAWYSDATVSAGTPTDLSSYRPPQHFDPAPGKKAGDVIDVEIAANDYCFAWYADRSVSFGTSRNLAAHDQARPYTLYGSHGPTQLLGVAIAGSNDYVYAWYKDGTVSVGTAHDLNWHGNRYPFQPPPEADPGPGRLSLMSRHDGSDVPHFDPWTKMKLGWLDPTPVEHSGTKLVHDVETHHVAYILHDPAHGRQEYFIVENRFPGTSFESDLTGGGLAIWHIHERQPFKNHEEHWGRKTIHLVKPLGLDLRNERDEKTPLRPSGEYLWDGADPRRSYDLDANSVPANTRWDDGSDSGIRIHDISHASATMSVRFEVP